MQEPVLLGTESGVPARNPRRMLVGVGILLALGVGAWWITRSQAASKGGLKTSDSAALPLVTVVTPARGKVMGIVSVTGQISAQNDMPIGVEGEGGRIAAVLVEPGDRVHRGQVLARLNPLSAQSQVAGAEASLDELRSAAVTAQAEYARAEAARDSFSVEEFERRKTTSMAARAKVKAAEAQVSSAHTMWARTTVVAPSDGIVLSRAAEVGQTSMPGSAPLFHLANHGEIEMRGQVAEQDMPRLKVGQSAQVRLDGVALPFTGKIWQVGAIIDSMTRQGMVRIALPAADQNLRPGAFARADIQAGATVGVLLPQTAMLSDDEGTYVLIVGADQTVVRRAVTVAGARSEGLLVSRGLEGNERVVAIAGAFLRAGEKVKVAADAPAAASAADSDKAADARSGGASAGVGAP